ncbi:Vps51/Vps67 [Moelleriella libera RCEF 2490]|uniref:Vacuolar protein sorting-associated protein 51 homolog n=1 Tax=Moelleriella libera RCEF 2490 TaxID=1081109 RepID=A0A167Z4K6_9HYPO|nr:Vps51/Vps67 [Moelleriella libera RCEF 2490]
MSTIASPRAATAPRPPALAETPPPSSGRPSFDASSSTTTTTAAGAGGGASSPQATAPKRSNRAALREYYKIRAAPAPPRIELEVAGSEVPASDLDAPDFNAAEYVARTMNTLGLEDLLRLYTQVVGEVRALDAEKKALVYDNYSKLITATETIRKVS